VPVVYRLVKKRHPIYDIGGAVRVGGRWTSPGVGVIYTAEHYATAILELLVHRGRVELPGPHHAAAIIVPDDLRIERFDPATHPGWDLEGSSVARAYGDGWAAAARTPVLAVPSVPGQPAEWNYVINPGHPEATRIRPLDPFDVVWDGRLFGPPPGTVATAP
jgi:RES domain-containing protein